MKKISLFLLCLFFIQNNLFAKSLSIFGGSYDYDDDNTSSLFGLNYHLTNNDFNILGVLDLNPVIGVLFLESLLVCFTAVLKRTLVVISFTLIFHLL